MRMSISPSCVRSVRRLIRADTGIAAVEFAILLPFMLFLYVGATELVQAMITSRKASVIARTLADLVAQQPANTDLTAAQLNDIITGAKAIMAPYAISSLKLTVSSIEFSAKTPPATGYDAKTKWSVTNNGGALRPCGTLTSAPDGVNGGITTVPAGLYGPGSIIVADVAYAYTPTFGGGVLAWTTQSSSVQMARSMLMRPRLQDTIKYVGGNGVVCF
jgi:Flp pilus assembly protein TadG